MQKTDTFITSARGDRLAITQQFNADANLTGIVLHGFQSNRRSPSAQAAFDILIDQGFNAIALDFQAHGDSDGKFEDLTIDRVIDDVGSVITYILQQNPTQKFILIASSFGGLIAQYAAARFFEPVVGLVLRAPVSDWWALWQHRVTNDEIKVWEKTGFHIGRTSTGPLTRFGRPFLDDIRRTNFYATIVPHIKIPTLIIHGDADETVPITQSEKLNDSLSYSELIVLPGADHRFSQLHDMQAYQQEIAKFLTDKKILP